METSPILKDGKDLIQLKQKTFVMISALGSKFNTDLKLTYFIDPKTGQFTYHDSYVKQGQTELNSAIYIENDTTFTSYDTGLPVNDIYVRHYSTEEVFITCGDGTYSDGVYRVEYAGGEIIGLTLINLFLYPNKIYEYENWLVVGCLNSEGMWLVEPIEMGEMHQIGTELNFEDVYCFETYPMYCYNIMVGTDNGVYLGTNLDYPKDISVFEAYWNYSEDVAIIHWRTESETDVIGFNIYRNDEDDFSTAFKKLMFL